MKVIKHKDKWYLQSDTGYKEILLSTDELLIKDGVQAIDDEFLEWFVKNPSCEKVEVSYGILKPFQSTNKGYIIHLPDNDVLEKPKQEYERGITITHVDKQETFEETHQLCNTGVIIPKTTQQIIDEDFDGGLTMGEIIPKEETICIQTGLPCGIQCFSEDTCNRSKPKKETIEEVAKRYTTKKKHEYDSSTRSFIDGAKWQQERSYSEEEVSDLLKCLRIELNINKELIDIEEWFEQFKKQ
jgi:hypothetical protein